MRSLKIQILFILTAVLILASCSNASIKEEQKIAEANVMKVFKGKGKKPNTEAEGLNFYMPTGVSIEDTKQSNVILKRDSKVYILFYNPNESAKSEVVYQSTVSDTEKYRINKTFTHDNRLGYFVVRDTGEDEYEIVVGVGGVKLTTQTDADEIAFDAELMMEIASSIDQKEE